MYSSRIIKEFWNESWKREDVGREQEKYLKEASACDFSVDSGSQE